MQGDTEAGTAVTEPVPRPASAPAAGWRERLGGSTSELVVVPAFIALAAIVLWSAHDGGYDEDTWYWGALLMLALVGAMAALGIARWWQLPRTLRIAIVGFGGYVAWSYLSIAWAASPGDALTGSNRALLYLLVLLVFALTPWTLRRAAAILVSYAIAIGAIGAILLLAMADGHRVTSLFSEGRLISPTGYFNSSAALFMAAGLVATALSVRRDVPAVLRGLLIAIATAGLQLALLGESRGWLFTLPFVLLASLLVVRDRLRTIGAAVVPLVATLACLRPLLDVYKVQTSGASVARLTHAVEHAGKLSLLSCAVAFLVGTLIAVLDSRYSPKTVARNTVRVAGAAIAVVVVVGALAGVFAATHGHPVPFVKRQWNGFTASSGESAPSSSHFATVGTGRFDFWRVAGDAFLAHPIGGLGQDNFADYYLPRRHTWQEPQWTHSIEMRLLAHTGIVGTALFLVFLVGALVAAARNRRRPPPSAGQLVGVALLPLMVWLIHGSVDWFWEFPALSGPALGFLALGAAFSGTRSAGAETPVWWRRIPRPAAWAGAGLAFAAAVVLLGFPYLSVREVSTASNIRNLNSGAAIRDLKTAADLNPLDSQPARLAGTIALESGNFQQAQNLFSKAIDRERGGWFPWFGAGLAASALGNDVQARSYLRQAYAINNRQPAVKEALTRVSTTHPLTPAEALRLLILAH